MILAGVRHAVRALLASALGGLATAALALECSVGVPPPETEPDNPEHHPVSRNLPRTAGYNQPDRCGEGMWYFDQDGNGRPGPREARLYGPERTLVCASCHTDDPARDSPAATSVFLRQDASTLCLVCHNL